MTTYEEWRVTGRPRLATINRRYSAEDFADPEDAARCYAAAIPWTEGPHLHKRTVTVTDWQEAEA